jgi:hypothetical protein
MGAPLKEGLDYFSFDVDFFEDEKIEAIAGEFGIKGELATVKLLCAIYRNGYFVVWNDLLKMKLLKRMPGCSAELLDGIVDRLVKWEFFDKTLFDSDKILTSAGIQKRYKAATKRRLNPRIDVYVCSNRDNVYINDSSEVFNVDINRQSKVNESKINESKEVPPPNLGEGEIVTESPSMVLRKLFPRILVDKAKTYGLSPDEIDAELSKWDEHHSDNRTAFSDTKHMLNSWAKWCEFIFKDKQQNLINGTGKQQITTTKKPTDKTAADWH